uniref:Uncharacterized protein n=1 Tax=Strongyloides papillosus TaxID=174720 RepID=A0A0N5BLT3_STREA
MFLRIFTTLIIVLMFYNHYNSFVEGFLNTIVSGKPYWKIGNEETKGTIDIKCKNYVSTGRQKLINNSIYTVIVESKEDKIPDDCNVEITYRVKRKLKTVCENSGHWDLKNHQVACFLYMDDTDLLIEKRIP